MNSTNPTVFQNARNFVVQDTNFNSITAETINIGGEGKHEVSGLGRSPGPQQNIDTNMDTEINCLPSRPKLFVGREDIVAKITATLVLSNHAALVGTGGIGKSHIAIAILHEHDIKVKFNQYRYFIRYDNMSASMVNFDTFLDRIVGSLGVIAPSGADRRDAVLRHLRNAKNDILLVLDNAETFLDSKHDLKHISDFVVELGDMKSVTLMFTTRSRAIPPLIGYVTFNIPGLGKIPARAAFMSIYTPDISLDSMDKLLSAVEFHPLSIILLANAGAVNNWPPKMLEEAWERESASVLEKSGAGGFGTTVEVSLKSPSIEKLATNARTFLHVVALLPQGVHLKKLKQIFPSFNNIHDISNTMCIHSLTYRSGNFITMLAPIRLYILHYYAKEVARDTCFNSTLRTYYRELLLETASDGKWIVDEDANVERLVALDLETPGEMGHLTCVNFIHLLFWYKIRPVNLESLILALPEDKPKIFLSVLRSFTRPRHIRLSASSSLSFRVPIPWAHAPNQKILSKANCLEYLAYINYKLGCLTASIRLLGQAGRLYLSQKDWLWAIECLVQSAETLQECGKYSQAGGLLKQAYCLARKCRNPLLQARVDLWTGDFLLYKGDPEGLSLCKSAKMTFEKLGDTFQRTQSLLWLGYWAITLKDPSAAKEYYNTLMEQSNLNQSDKLRAKVGLILVAFGEGEGGHALQMRDELVTIYPMIEAVKERIFILSYLADWAADEGRFTDARDYVCAFNHLQDKHITLASEWLEAKLSEARVELFDRNFVKARELMIAFTDNCGDWMEFKIRGFRVLGEIAILENDHETANEYFLRLKEFCEENGINPEIYGGNKFNNQLTNAFTQKDIFRGWPEFLERERLLDRRGSGKSPPSLEVISKQCGNK